MHHRSRLAFKPGLTGMWQVSGRSNITDFEEVVRLDTEYIKKWSPGLDIMILFKTVAVVLVLGDYGKDAFYIKKHLQRTKYLCSMKTVMVTTMFIVFFVKMEQGFMKRI